MTPTLEDHLDENQRRWWAGLTSPFQIQAFLDETPYSPADFNRCPLRVIRDGQANCFDGALLAAAALRRLGNPARIIDLLPEPGTDDDHVLAVFRRGSGWGALAKSNFSGLRYREPVYRSLRELVMSYFDVFFNLAGQKTLRGYTRPLRLAAFDRLNWEVDDRVIEVIETGLNRLQPVSVLSPEMGKKMREDVGSMPPEAQGDIQDNRQDDTEQDRCQNGNDTGQTPQVDLQRSGQLLQTGDSAQQPEQASDDHNHQAQDYQPTSKGAKIWHRINP